jgi:hypothetical protein
MAVSDGVGLCQHESQDVATQIVDAGRVGSARRCERRRHERGKGRVTEAGPAAYTARQLADAPKMIDASARSDAGELGGTAG